MLFGNNMPAESVTREQNGDDDTSWWDEESVLVAVDLGYDESGAGDILLVSVQVGITEQAKKLKRHWKSRLGNLEFFHSKDFGNYSHGVFAKAGLLVKRSDR
jgi:hypothetical protein